MRMLQRRASRASAVRGLTQRERRWSAERLPAVKSRCDALLSMREHQRSISTHISCRPERIATYLQPHRPNAASGPLRAAAPTADGAAPRHAVAASAPPALIVRPKKPTIGPKHNRLLPR